MTKVIFLNGPPRSGKDTAADYLYYTYDNITTIKFADPLHNMAQAMLDDLGISFDDSYKDKIIEALGVSYRQFLIDMAEKFMKPLYGKDIFARIALEKIKFINSDSSEYEQEDVVVISDLGFIEEAQMIIDYLGKENCHLIQIERENCNFNNDSRKYINLDVPTTKILNDTLDAYEARLSKIYNSVSPDKN